MSPPPRPRSSTTDEALRRTRSAAIASMARRRARRGGGHGALGAGRRAPASPARRLDAHRPRAHRRDRRLAALFRAQPFRLPRLDPLREAHPGKRGVRAESPRPATRMCAACSSRPPGSSAGGRARACARAWRAAPSRPRCASAPPPPSGAYAAAGCASMSAASTSGRCRGGRPRGHRRLVLEPCRDGRLRGLAERRRGERAGRVPRSIREPAMSNPGMRGPRSILEKRQLPTQRRSCG